MENLQALWVEMEASKEEITRLTKLNLSNSGKGEELDINLEAAFKKRDQAMAELKKTQEELKSLVDAQLMLRGAKLQIRESVVEIARLTNALKEVTKKVKSNPKKRLID